MILFGKQRHVTFFKAMYLHDENEPYKMLLAAFYKVGRVIAIDEDHPPNCVTYKIANGDTQVIQRFWIHPLSGMIELTTQPDYESVKQYNLTVEAVDCDRFHSRTAMTMVTVDIENENDEAPVCTPSLYKTVIFDNVALGTNVNGFALNCHDRHSQVGDGNQKEIIATGNRNKKLEVLTETTVYETVFDGEVIDPVSGNVYEYNSRAGARKWKKTPRHQKEPLANTHSPPEVHPLEESTSLNIPLQG
ncbi:cadherin-related family member 3-like [Chlorocebus sabaeus]|uniref:cadherin-related family member 3-like n=1 Tax=Chlorocebus sabaeus TaxID=60711 RepID=UPI0018B048DD|nr:cadherin-related family member 3-like isoform X2 [Chlorocebus sabaeus]